MTEAIEATISSPGSVPVNSAVTPWSVLEAQPLSVSSACRSLGVARSTFSRYRSYDPFVDSAVELRNRIQLIALDWPYYGYRRITHELKRQGVDRGAKTVLRLMREDNLLCLRKRRFKIATTDSNHALPVYPNLAKDLVVTGRDQLWVADLTYIRLGAEFVYLAMVMDAFSRKIVGWSLSRRIDAALAVDALAMAIAERQPASGTLVDHGTAISMSRKGIPQDNAYAESFMKTLKYEEVYMAEYENITEAKHQIGHFVEEVYNKKRRHSAIGYTPPAEFESLSQHKEKVIP